MSTTDILTSTFITFRDKLFRLASGIAGQTDADDIINDAFCRLWSHHPLVNDEMHALKLSYTAVKNSAIDTLRRSTVRQTVSLDDDDERGFPEPDDTESEERKERQATIDAVVQLARKTLSERQFEIFELHDIEGIDYDDIATRLKMSPENVRMTLSRARKTIRKLYKQQYES